MGLLYLSNVNYYLLSLWIVILILAVIIEVSTQELVSIWFAVAAIPALILTAFGINFWWQLLGFVLTTAIAFVFSKLFIKKRLKVNLRATNADSLIGTEILVVESVSHSSLGTGKVRDVIWTIASDDEIKENEFAIVKEIKGNKLIVKKKEEK